MQNSILTSPRRQNLEKADYPLTKNDIENHPFISSRQSPEKYFSAPSTGGKAKKGNHLIKLLNGALTSLLHLEEERRKPIRIGCSFVMMLSEEQLCRKFQAPVPGVSQDKP
ncbi:hypothetical protein CEXT_793931 [Caerostris extrusa]|uniref:Uncharacterized protein n=1 Tax=Caerostris extrusa TaxID=172846 RepID=A0AAV4PRI5_CAEEX|nr:hypothetical protein CEXT_793931 [Caerostris extrusa]